jgi:hypothetical protein
VDRAVAPVSPITDVAKQKLSEIASALVTTLKPQHYLQAIFHGL